MQQPDITKTPNKQADKQADKQDCRRNLDPLALGAAERDLGYLDAALQEPALRRRFLAAHRVYEARRIAQLVEGVSLDPLAVALYRLRGTVGAAASRPLRAAVDLLGVLERLTADGAPDWADAEGIIEVALAAMRTTASLTEEGASRWSVDRDAAAAVAEAIDRADGGGLLAVGRTLRTACRRAVLDDAGVLVVRDGTRAMTVPGTHQPRLALGFLAAVMASPRACGLTAARMFLGAGFSFGDLRPVLEAPDGWEPAFVAAAARAGRRMRQHLTTIRYLWESWERRGLPATGATAAVLELLPAQPAVTAAWIERSVPLSKRGARLVLDRLLAAGVLRPVGRAPRDCVYLSDDMLGLN